MSDCREAVYPNLMLVAGTGRNSGKTSFVCQVCEEWALPLPLLCIKISNHIHVQEGTKPVFTTPEFTIYEETMVTSDKDTARMLKAGASRVLFIEADREFVFPAFEQALKLVPPNSAIICESGTLRRYIQPSLFIMLHTIGSEPKESSKDLILLADKVFYSPKESLNIPKMPVVFNSGRWKINCA